MTEDNIFMIMVVVIPIVAIVVLIIGDRSEAARVREIRENNAKIKPSQESSSNSSTLGIADTTTISSSKEDFHSTALGHNEESNSSTFIISSTFGDNPNSNSSDFNESFENKERRERDEEIGNFNSEHDTNDDFSNNDSIIDRVEENSKEISSSDNFSNSNENSEFGSDDLDDLRTNRSSSDADDSLTKKV